MAVEEPTSVLNNLFPDLGTVVGWIGHGSSSFYLREVCLERNSSCQENMILNIFWSNALMPQPWATTIWEGDNESE
jgi:hypothetical protein